MNTKYNLESITARANQIKDSESPYSKEDVNDIVDVMLSFAINDINLKLAEALCEKFIKNSDETLQMNAITSVAHIARVYRRQVNFNIMEEIYRIYNNPKHILWGTADDTLDDLELFLKICKPEVPTLSEKVE